MLSSIQRTLRRVRRIPAYIKQVYSRSAPYFVETPICEEPLRNMGLKAYFKAMFIEGQRELDAIFAEAEQELQRVKREIKEELI